MPTHAPDGHPVGADLKIVNARLVTPTGVRESAVAVRDGVIVAIGDATDLPDARETIDARGRYVLPGVVDPEAHPGHSHPLRDVIPSESRAAVASGVTTWGIQNPAPRFGQEPWKQESEPDDVVSFFEVFEKGLGIWSELAHTDFFFTFQLETDEQAEEIPRYARELGIPSVKFYCHTKRIANDSFWFASATGLARGFDDGTLYLACERAAEVGAMVHIHPENWEIARVLEKRLLAAGRDDMGAWDDRSPWFTEAHHVRQYSYFGLLTGATMYVQHTTNPLTLREIRRAREEGVRLYSQTGAPWLYFTRDDWRINTPLRSREAVEALWEAVADGTVDCVGSDHVVARGKRTEMAAEGVWSRNKSGFPSRVEMLLPILLSEGVNKGRIGIERLVEICASTPAKIFGLWPRKGAIAVGSDADFVVVDLDREVEVRDEMVHTQPGWTLLHGHRLTGWPVMTILRGRVVAEWRDGEPRAEVLGEPDGRHLAPRDRPHRPHSPARAAAARVAAGDMSSARRGTAGSGSRPRPWDSVITDRDRAILAASGMGQRGGIGSRPCLLVVDITYAFTGDRPEPILESVKRFPNSCGEVAWETLPRIAELIAAMRARSLPVIYTRQAPRVDAVTAGAWARKNSRVLAETPVEVDPMQIPDLIAPEPGEIVIDKDKPSAFFGTTLLSYLHALRVDSIIIAGTSTSGCVRSSGVDAFSYNYPTAVVEDCCFDRSPTSHAIALFDLHSRYADVLPLDELLPMLDGAGTAGEIVAPENR